MIKIVYIFNVLLYKLLNHKTRTKFQRIEFGILQVRFKIDQNTSNEQSKAHAFSIELIENSLITLAQQAQNVAITQKMFRMLRFWFIINQAKMFHYQRLQYVYRIFRSNR